jgi:hypothetical protein
MEELQRKRAIAPADDANHRQRALSGAAQRARVSFEERDGQILRIKAASNPSSTSRWRVRATVNDGDASNSAEAGSDQYADQDVARQVDQSHGDAAHFFSSNKLDATAQLSQPVVCGADAADAQVALIGS